MAPKRKLSARKSSVEEENRLLKKKRKCSDIKSKILAKPAVSPRIEKVESKTSAFVVKPIVPVTKNKQAETSLMIQALLLRKKQEMNLAQSTRERDTEMNGCEEKVKYCMAPRLLKKITAKNNLSRNQKKGMKDEDDNDDDDDDGDNINGDESSGTSDHSFSETKKKQVKERNDDDDRDDEKEEGKKRVGVNRGSDKKGVVNGQRAGLIGSSKKRSVGSRSTLLTVQNNDDKEEMDVDSDDEEEDEASNRSLSNQKMEEDEEKDDKNDGDDDDDDDEEEEGEGKKKVCVNAGGDITGPKTIDSDTVKTGDVQKGLNGVTSLSEENVECGTILLTVQKEDDKEDEDEDEDDDNEENESMLCSTESSPKIVMKNQEEVKNHMKESLVQMLAGVVGMPTPYAALLSMLPKNISPSSIEQAFPQHIRKIEFRNAFSAIVYLDSKDDLEAIVLPPYPLIDGEQILVQEMYGICIYNLPLCKPTEEIEFAIWNSLPNVNSVVCISKELHCGFAFVQGKTNDIYNVALDFSSVEEHLECTEKLLFTTPRQFCLDFTQSFYYPGFREVSLDALESELESCFKELAFTKKVFICAMKDGLFKLIFQDKESGVKALLLHGRKILGHEMDFRVPIGTTWCVHVKDLCLDIEEEDVKRHFSDVCIKKMCFGEEGEEKETVAYIALESLTDLQKCLSLHQTRLCCKRICVNICSVEDKCPLREMDRPRTIKPPEEMQDETTEEV